MSTAAPPGWPTHRHEPEPYICQLGSKCTASAKYISCVEPMAVDTDAQDAMRCFSMELTRHRHAHS
eukprot:scaffold294132_cov40-Tisochrysis_lutea.AAC.2